MDSMSNIIRLANLGVGAAMVLGGITQIIHMTPQSIIIGCYAIMFGLGKFSGFYPLLWCRFLLVMISSVTLIRGVQLRN